jgi:hypothetical protein
MKVLLDLNVLRWLYYEISACPKGFDLETERSALLSLGRREDPPINFVYPESKLNLLHRDMFDLVQDDFVSLTKELVIAPSPFYDQLYAFIDEVNSIRGEKQDDMEVLLFAAICSDVSGIATFDTKLGPKLNDIRKTIRNRKPLRDFIQSTRPNFFNIECYLPSSLLAELSRT